MNEINDKVILTRQHGQQEDVVGEWDQAVRAELVEDAVLRQRQIQSMRNRLHHTLQVKTISACWLISCNKDAIRVWVFVRMENQKNKLAWAKNTNKLDRCSDRQIILRTDMKTEQQAEFCAELVETHIYLELLL